MRLKSPEQRGFEDRLRRQGKSMQTVKAPPVSFKALLAVAPPFDPDTPLGSDTREKCLMEILDCGAADPQIAENDFLIQQANMAKWQVVWRDNNPADFTIKYVLALNIPNVDS